MSAAVCFAAMIPASRAVSIALPFASAAVRICRSASGDMRTRPAATASRAVAGLSLTSTIRTRPSASTCVSAVGVVRTFRLAMAFESLPRLIRILALREEEREALERHRQVHVLQLHPARHLDGAGREVEDRLDPGGANRVDDGLGGGRGDGNHGNADGFALHDLPKVARVVDEHAAARSTAHLLFQRVE